MEKYIFIYLWEYIGILISFARVCAHAGARERIRTTHTRTREARQATGNGGKPLHPTAERCRHGSLNRFKARRSHPTWFSRVDTWFSSTNAVQVPQNDSCDGYKLLHAGETAPWLQGVNPICHCEAF